MSNACFEVLTFLQLAKQYIYANGIAKDCPQTVTDFVCSVLLYEYTGDVFVFNMLLVMCSHNI